VLFCPALEAGAKGEPWWQLKLPLKIQALEDLPPLLSAPTVCRLRNCHSSTLRRARKAGLLEFRQINARVFMYERESVLKWIGPSIAPIPTQKPPARRLKREEVV
jgi:hypothetical protein